MIIHLLIGYLLFGYQNTFKICDNIAAVPTYSSDHNECFVMLVIYGIPCRNFCSVTL